MKCQLAGCVLCNCKEKPGPTRTWKYFHDAQPGHLAEPRAGCLHYTSEKCTLCLQVCNSTFLQLFNSNLWNILSLFRGHETKSGCRRNLRISLHCSTIVFSNLDMVTRLQSCNVLAMAHSSQLPKHLFEQQCLYLVSLSAIVLLLWTTMHANLRCT